ncbi:MAG: dihydroorotase family protein [Candidatus Bathyarchaeota archaeon]|nr:dihydroorotase family protein [Candidatus Bathyarchaeota archaeon]MDH5623938.1 dihydroorotase family protein [Candidatus Bathyarchaeota archaeon]MDH5701538.1 dihydroorotase family protein [Candidatus Bathyarchaeota archaeon]
MPVDMVLHNAKIYTRGRIVEAGLAIDDGRILKIAKETNLPSASTRMNLKGHVTLPGLIDPHVHLRNQQLAYKEDFFSGTAAAAAGGVTLTIDMPNNKPVTMDSISLRERMRLAERRAVVNIAFYSVFPQKLEEVPSIVKEGAMAFKLYMSEKIGGLDVDDDKLLLQAFNRIANMGVPVAVHAEDRKILETRRREMEKTGRKDVEAYVKTHPPEAEARAIRRIVQLAKKCGVRVHFCHVSSAVGLNAFSTAKKDGLPVTCEVTPHHLLLSLEHLKRYRTLALTNPPLRTRKDVIALWGALKQGLIDALASDHAPHTLEEKEVESVWDAKPGIAGLETTLPLLLTEVSEGRLTITDLVRLTSEKPAEIFNLRNRGCLEEGNWADIVVVDMNRKYKIDASNFHSKAKYSPFDGWRVKGQPMKTFVNGQLVMDEGEIVAKPGTSQIIRWKG